MKRKKSEQKRNCFSLLSRVQSYIQKKILCSADEKKKYESKKNTKKKSHESSENWSFDIYKLARDNNAKKKISLGC